MAWVGRNTKIYVSTDDAAYNLVDDLNSVDQADEADNLDATKFGDTRKRFMPGFPGGNWELGGFYNPADTNGQRVMENAYDSGNDIWIKVLYDGTTGWKQKVKVSQFTKSSRVGDLVSVRIQLLPQAAPIRQP